MTAEELARHFPERVYQAMRLEFGGETLERTREVRCACGFALDVPEHLTAQKWAEHVIGAVVR